MQIDFKNKKANIKILLYVLLLFFVVFLFYWQMSRDKKIMEIVDQANIRKVVVNGFSMAPYISAGAELEADYSYQNEQKKIERNDVVVANYQNSLKKDLIKFVKVVPGDRFHVDEEKNILYINDQPMVNSEGNIMFLRKTGMISLYERSFGGVMPEDIFFIFGDQPNSIDSTRFGPVPRGKIEAKVIIN